MIYILCKLWVQLDNQWTQRLGLLTVVCIGRRGLLRVSMLPQDITDFSIVNTDTTHHINSDFFHVWLVEMDLCPRRFTVQEKTWNSHSSSHEHISLNVWSEWLKGVQIQIQVVYTNIRSEDHHTCVYLALKVQCERFRWIKVEIFAEMKCHIHHNVFISV